MVDYYLPLVYVLSGILSYISLSDAVAEGLKSSTKHEDLIRHLDTVHNQLQTLSRSIRSAHSDFARQEADVCSYFGPMSDTICDLEEVDNSLARSEALSQAIHGKFSPGKRSGDYSNLPQKRLLLREIMQTRELLDKLRKLVDAAESSVQIQRKRSCNVNLGFHCQTEQYSAIADMYNWFQNPLSPGRRRKRDIRAYKNTNLNW